MLPWLYMPETKEKVGCDQIEKAMQQVLQLQLQLQPFSIWSPVATAAGLGCKDLTCNGGIS